MKARWTLLRMTRHRFSLRVRNIRAYRPSCRLRDNENAYDRYKIRPRVLRNVSTLDPTTKVFGTKVAFPLALSPLAMQGLAHPDGEIAISGAAASMNIPMGLSTYATSNLEDIIAQGSGNPYAMQLSLLKNKDAMARMIQRAESKSATSGLLTIYCDARS